MRPLREAGGGGGGAIARSALRVISALTPAALLQYI